VIRIAYSQSTLQRQLLKKHRYIAVPLRGTSGSLVEHMGSSWPVGRPRQLVRISCLTSGTHPKRSICFWYIFFNQ
jgi:hypothetical protein